MTFQDAKKFLGQCSEAVDAAIRAQADMATAKTQSAEMEKKAAALMADATAKMKAADVKLLRATDAVANAKAEVEKTLARERESWEATTREAQAKAQKQLAEVEQALAVRAAQMKTVDAQIQASSERLKSLSAQIVTAKKDLHCAVDNA